MSSRTPEECVELATDASADREDREEALEALKLANECDELADLVRTEDLEDQYRQQAIHFMGTAQCDSMLQTLVDEESLEQPLQREAEEVLSDLES